MASARSHISLDIEEARLLLGAHGAQAVVDEAVGRRDAGPVLEVAVRRVVGVVGAEGGRVWQTKRSGSEFLTACSADVDVDNSDVQDKRDSHQPEPPAFVMSFLRSRTHSGRTVHLARVRANSADSDGRWALTIGPSRSVSVRWLVKIRAGSGRRRSAAVARHRCRLAHEQSAQHNGSVGLAARRAAHRSAAETRSW